MQEHTAPQLEVVLDDPAHVPFRQLTRKWLLDERAADTGQTRRIHVLMHEDRPDHGDAA